MCNFSFEKFVPPSWYNKANLVLQKLKKQGLTKIPRISIAYSYPVDDNKTDITENEKNDVDEKSADDTSQSKAKGKDAYHQEKSSVEL